MHKSLAFKLNKDTTAASPSSFHALTRVVQNGKPCATNLARWFIISLSLM